MYFSNGWIDGSTAANQKNQMFINDGGFFYLAPPASPEAFPGNSRSAIAFDMDRDGDLDVLVSNFRQPPVLLENTQATGNHWVELRLRAPAPNSRAIGARVTVKAGPKKVLREVTCGNGYLGQDEDVVAVGIGAATEAEVTIRWPNGKTQTLPKVEANKVTDVIQAP
jgi:enediyne biosynthesis protein E4